MKRGSIGNRCESGEDRGASPVIGFVILFGMILAGSILVVLVAGPLFDSLESESNRERAHMQMDQIDHAFSTATITDEPQSLGVSSSDDLSVVDDGSIEVEWYNDSDGDPFSPAADGCRAAGELRALEIDQGDRTIVHQGGGIWERNGDQSSIVSEPQIGYDDGTLQLHVMQLDEGDIGGSELAAKSDHSKSTELTEDIRKAATAEGCNEADLAFRIESSYHDAWYTYLEGALNVDGKAENVTVRHNSGDGSVEVEITNVRTVDESPTFVVEEDTGLWRGNNQIEPVISENDGAFRIGGVIANTANTTDTQTITLSVNGTNISDEISDLEIAGNSQVDISQQNNIPSNGLQIEPSEVKDLEPGKVYYYTIETEDDVLDEPGSFYYGKEGTHLDWADNITVENDTDGVTIELGVENIGTSSTDASATLTFDNLTGTDDEPIAVGITESDIDYGAQTTFEWNLNKSALPEGEHDFTIEADGKSWSGTVNGTGSAGEGSFIVVEDEGVDDPTISDPRIVRYDSTEFFVQASILSTYTSDEERDVMLTIPGAQFETNESVSLEGGEQDTHGFTVSLEDGEFEPGTVYKYDIVADGGGLTETGAFYVGADGTQFDVDVAQNETEDGTVTISADATNIGIEDTEGADATLTFEDLTDADGNALSTSIEDLEFDAGANSSLEWTLNRTALPPVENGVAIEIDGDQVWNGTIVGEATGDGEAFVVVEDEGVDDPSVDREQIVQNDGDSFTVNAGIASTYSYDNVTETATLTIPDAGVEIDEEVTLDSGERTTVPFEVDPAEYDFENGTVYEYDVQAENSSLSGTGTFYVGQPGTHFELANGTATVDETVTISANVHNTGIEDGNQLVDFDLEFLDDLPNELEEDPYADVDIDASDIERSFGENGTVELEFNQSVLIRGDYEATIATENDKITVPFEVDAGVDPSRVGLGEIEDAEITVEVLGSQVSGDGITGDHQLAPMTLEVVANGESIHTFENPEGGDNINTGPTWQDKNNESYRYSFPVDEETELTLRNTRYGAVEQTWWWQTPICSDQITDPETLPHYDGPTHTDLAWCTDVPETVEFGPIDASQGQNLQNVRVRSAENNTIPALPAGTDQQLSATEILEQHGLVAESGDELDLESGEFVFLFENTESTDAEGIDALWNEAINAYEQNPDQTHDPNFNDLIVYVDVERAGVDPGTPSITIMPGGGDSTEVDPGNGTDAGTADDVDPGLEGNSSESTDLELDRGTGSDADAPEASDPGLEGSATGSEGPKPSSGSSSYDDDDTGAGTDDIGIDLSSDYIVVG